MQVAVGCRLSRFSLRPPSPTHLDRCGTLQVAQVAPVARWPAPSDLASFEPDLYFSSCTLLRCIAPGDLVMWKRRKGAC